MKTKYQLLLASVLITFTTVSCDAQNIHPYKAKFGDFSTWSSTVPGDVTLKNFKPYRAVYTRAYNDRNGESRTDKVIMTAQKVYWYGRTAILFEYHDAGSGEFTDTNARTQFYYLDESTLELLLAVGPTLGTPEDYTTVRLLEDKIATSSVNTATGETNFRELPKDGPVFPFSQLRFLIWGAMDLNVGDKVKLERLYTASQNGLQPVLGIAAEQIDYTAPDGKKYRPIVVENTANPTTPILNKFFVINEPPYVLAQGLYNADDDEIYRWFLKLDSFELLDGK